MISGKPGKHGVSATWPEPSSVYSGFWDVLGFAVSTSSRGTLSYLLPSLSPDLGVCDSTCFTHVYQTDPPRIVAIEEARPLNSFRLARKHAKTSAKHLRGDHITK